jgi:NAD(P) transhydrogenase subunit alpha
MIVGVVQETFPGERRVALVPSLVPNLTKIGYEVVVQAGAGASAGFVDAEFAERGAQVLAQRGDVFARADLILQVRGLGANLEQGAADLPALRRGQLLVGMFEPLGTPDALKMLADRGVSVLALELLPRISRAQSMDVLSSMATVAGYRAVLLGALELPKLFPMMITAAGTLTPAKLLVVGAGVAGLQAIATARKLGAVVSAYDVRPAVKLEVQSLGAKFVELELDTAQSQDQGGYAKAEGEEFYRRQRELLARVVAEQDVVVTTAAVPGRKAPVLITAEMARGMRPGSVIVDLAAERGGNCELTQAGRTIIDHGVSILGPVNVPASAPYHASQMFSKNLVNLLVHLTKEGKPLLEGDDEILRGTLAAHAGQVCHPQVMQALGLAGTAAGA